jgi:glycosyltransferase involved in cell wall biosynthesis
MSEAIPIAFYAPLKSPLHPSPSGDRSMARLLLKALAGAGFEPTLASSLRTFDGTGDPSLQDRLRKDSEIEADRLAADYCALPAPQRPRLWFTYHVHHKAPDWIGPRVVGELGIPYVVAEGSRAAKHADGPWALGYQGAETALDRADAIFVMTEADREALERARPEGQQLINLPPCLDLGGWAPEAASARLRDGRDDAVRLLTVAMMRPGDKLASYRLLAEALGGLGNRRWRLDVVGNGEARAEVEGLFAVFAPRVRFHGLIEDRASLARLYGEADLFVWPAVNEAYGIVLLEAQASGCPVVAGGYGGVASVVRDGQTGVLTSPGDAAAFAAAVAALIDDPARRRSLGEAGQRFVHEERRLGHAAERLRSALMPLVTAGSR